MSDHAPPHEMNDSQALPEEPWYTDCGIWQPRVGNLVRWLHANNCSEYAHRLELEARSVSSCSTPEAEAVALEAVLRHLAHVHNKPPRHLTPEQYKALAVYCDEAIRSGLARQRQLASAYEAHKRAVRSAQEHLEALRKANPKEPPTTGTEQITLRARVAAFVLDRAEALHRLPTLDEVFRAFPKDDLGSKSTFYRRNPWYVTLREAAKKTLQRDAPRRGYRNAADDGGPGDIDSLAEAPDYHQDEAV